MTLLEQLSEKFRHHDMEILRTFVPQGDCPRVVQQYYTSSKMGSFISEERWLIRTYKRVYMGKTFEEAAEKALK